MKRLAILTAQGDFSLSVLAHPVLVAMYPALALLAENRTEISIHDSLRSLVLLPSLALVLLLVASLALASWQRGAVLTSVMLLLFFSCGHVYSQLKDSQLAGFLVGRHRILIPIWLLLGVGSLSIVWRHATSLSVANRTLAISAVALIILPLTSIGPYEVRRLSYSDLEVGPPDNSQYSITAGPDTELPDVYYIIPDAYARWDVLSEGFGYDNTEFYRYLVDRGFYVANESNTNYLWTHLSLASSLNMNFFQDLAPAGVSEIREVTGRLLLNSLVRKELEAAGYKTVGFATGWAGSEMLDADYVSTPDMTGFEATKARGLLNAYEGMLIENSMLKILLDIDSLLGTSLARYANERLQTPFTVQRVVILSLFDNVKRVTEIEGPKFVFVHILAPHGPSIFGREGEEIQTSGPFTLADDPDIPTELGNKRYVDELVYITHRIEETIDYIQSHSKRRVVVILQSDHGARPSLEWENPTIHAVREKTGILNTYYLPGSCPSLLYPTISPANSFRVLFNCEFGMSLPMLDDVTFIGQNDFTLSENCFEQLEKSQTDN